MTTSISSWAENYIASREKWPKPEIERSEIRQATRIFEKCIAGELSAIDGASGIAAIFNPRLIASRCRNYESLWVIIASASREFSGLEAERLAELFVAITQLPDVEDGIGVLEVCKLSSVWRDMRWGSWVYWEHGLDLDWQYDMYSDSAEDAERWFEQAPGKLNSTTFAANVLARMGAESGMWHHASDAMHMAFDSYDTTVEKEIRDGKEFILRDPDRELEREWRMWIPPAVEWILVAGERLYEFCFCEVPEEKMKFKGDRRDSGDRIFSKERWEYWKSWFRDLMTWEEVDERCRGLMERALEKMEALEAQFGYVVVDGTSLDGRLIFPEVAGDGCR